MIGKAGTGSDFRGLARYLLREREGEEGRVAWTLVRNLPGDERHAAALMDATAAQNVRVQKPVYHLSLSAAPGEELDRERWEKVVDRVLRDLGLEDHQALVVRHTDAQHDHVHVMVNRVDIETLKVWHNGHDYRRIEQSLRGIEREHGLREVPGRHGRFAGQERPERGAELTSGERREKERTERLVWAERVKFRVHSHLKEAKSWPDLERRLAGHRLRLEKRGPGLVVTDGRRRVKASRLYRGASYGQLEKRFGMSFDEWRAAKRELVETVDRLEKVDRARAQLRREERDLRGRIEVIWYVRQRHQQLKSDERELTQRFDQEFRRIFVPQDIARARQEVVRQAQREGWEEVARRLRNEPQRFGRVLGRGLGPMKSARREAALENAKWLGRVARRIGAVQAARIAVGPKAVHGLERMRSLSGKLARVTKALDRMPTRRQVELEVAQKALALGVSVVQLTLAPNPLRAVKTALRTAELVRSAARGDQGMERER